MSERVLVGISLIILASVASFQTIQLRLERRLGTERLTELRLATISQTALEGVLLDYIWGDQAEDATVGEVETRLLMVADVACSACTRALSAFTERGMDAELTVASFLDSPHAVDEWLVRVGNSSKVLRVPLDSTAFRHLPRTLTPIFVEFVAGEPVDIHFGPPKDSWLAHPPGAM